MVGKIVVALAGVLLAIATELFFPIDGNNPGAQKQKHFWAMIFLIFSMVLGLPIELSFETQQKVDRLQEKLDKRIAAQASWGKIEQLHMAYDENFGTADPILRGWADRTFEYLMQNMGQGLMPLVKEEAPEEIGKAYEGANVSIIATNVGGTKYYFTNGNYKAYNAGAADRGIPVIRFYLYSRNPNYHLEMRSGKRAETLGEFFNEVKELHRDLHSFYSAVIDVDEAHLPKVRDVLIMDNKFAAETVLSDTDWDPIRALATENQDRIMDIRRYLHTLLSAIDSRYVERMSSTDVKQSFQKRFPIQTSGSNPSEDLFRYLMGLLDTSSTKPTLAFVGPERP